MACRLPQRDRAEWRVDWIVNIPPVFSGLPGYNPSNACSLVDQSTQQGRFNAVRRSSPQVMPAKFVPRNIVAVFLVVLLVLSTKQSRAGYPARAADRK